MLLCENMRLKGPDHLLVYFFNRVHRKMVKFIWKSHDELYPSKDITIVDISGIEMR